MKNKFSILKIQIISIIFILVLGTILHFTYNLFNQNVLVGIFCAVNESTWEHLKLIYYPMLITIFIGKYYLKDNYSNYLCLKTKGILMSFLFIIIFFYTYTGVIGGNISVFNILSFILAVIFSEVFVYKKLSKTKSCDIKLAILLLLIIFFCFVIFTFSPPQIGLFKDPITSNYGI